MAESSASRTQHAVRLLTLLRVCGDPVGGSDPVGTVNVIRAEKRLQALDFWLRNPDYLADELVTAVEDGRLDRGYLDIAAGLLNDSEPSWHHFPMPKWFYGAYEAVDDAFSLLQAHGLALVKRRGTPGHRLQNQFYLTELGASMAEELRVTELLAWYPKQAELVALVAGSDHGSRLKERQYQQDTYSQTVWGNDIGSIREQVEIRLLEQQQDTGEEPSSSKVEATR